MNGLSKALLTLGLFACLLMVPSSAFTQTTGAIAGEVVDANGGALPGVVITAINEPTGIRYSAVSRVNGRFDMLNVRVGGPYTVTSELDGFKPDEVKDVFVRLGEPVELTVTLQLATITETLNVVADADTLISPSRTGATSTVNVVQLERLPTVDRSIQDFARLNPYFSETRNGTQKALSVAGRNNRYNNIQIDGAVNNDLFGLAATGTPGGQAETQPISFDTIQELQLLVSPYDVRQGGFSGGGINAVTKTGSNKFSGSAYYYTRDQDLVGDGPNDREFGTFEQEQYGVSIGGPLVEDKIFFFVNGDISERQTPSGWSINGSGNQFGQVDNVNRFLGILGSQYGYVPGGLEEFTRGTDSDKIFARLDFNLSDKHQLTLRHNFVDAVNDVGRPSGSRFIFGDGFYNFESETNSTVFQVNSVFGPNTFNEFRVSFQSVQEMRGGPTRFPNVTVELPNGDDLVAGRERFSTANSLDQDILEIHNDFTWIRGDHTITIGTHNELFDFNNLFIRDNFGSYSFYSLDDFEAGRAYSFDYSFSATSDPQQAAKFDVRQLGLYVGDQWRVNENLSLTYGLRVDMPDFPDTPTRNPAAENVFGRRTNITAGDDPIFSPRIGFNWDPTGEGRSQLRGGVGLFAGRAPYVWLSNQYSNTGIEFTRVSSFIPDSSFGPDNFINFVANPDGQPTSVGNAATNEINLVDPNFELPQVLRYSLGYDHEFDFWNLRGTAEVIYSDTQEDILYQNLNWVESGQTFFDGRPLMTQVDRDFRDVIFLTNTSEGDAWNAAIKIERPFQKGFYGSVSYAWGQSRSINDGTSSQARSNWRFLYVQGNPNEPTLAPSNFDVEHRFNIALSYNFEIFNGLSSTVSAFYNAQSGRPYSTTFSNSVNGEFESNDLLYVPASEGEVVLVGATWDEFNSYINADEGLRDARGSIVKRNASREPWTHTMDVRWAVQIPVAGREVELTLDILNFGNLLDSDSGVIRETRFNEVSPVRFGGLAEDGRPIYRVNFTDPDERFDINDFWSRWQAQLGLRFRF